MNPIEDILVTFILNSGKTVMFDTKLKYIPKIKYAVEESGKHDRHKLTPINDFIPKDRIGGPDISICMYDVVGVIDVSVVDAQKIEQKMKQKAKSGIFVPTAVQKLQTIRIGKENR